jgi:putative spermidine/putrescine transport system substrate-binding protein
MMIARMHAVPGRIAAALLCLSTVGPSGALADSPDSLITAAKAEGSLTLIAYNRDWCGYGEAIDAFKTKYGLAINEINPRANAGEVLEALRANKDNTGSQAPDVIEIGAAFGAIAKQEGLLLPYRAALWDAIPEDAKDADGYWYGETFGVMAFEINADIVKTIPEDWNDLLKPDYAHSIGVTSDPRTSNQALQAIYAAGIAATGGEGAQAAEAGIAFFKELVSRGNFVSANANAAAIAQGTTPITIRWDFLALGEKEALAGNPEIAVVIPKSGTVAGMNAYAISAAAPHPNAAKLWVDYLNSDEGQLNFIRHRCHPARFDGLRADGKIPADLLAALPPTDAYATAARPSLEALAAAKDVIVKSWLNVIGADK